MARCYSCIHPKTGTSAIVLLLLTSALIPSGVSSLHAQQNATPPGPGPVFRRVATYSTAGLFSRSAAVGDFNGDGKLDLVVTNQCQDVDCFNGSVTARLGNGDGTFGDALISYAGHAAANSVVVGDFNHDGTPDLGVASLCVPFFAIFGDFIGEVHGLAGNGDGTFNFTDFVFATLTPPSPCPFSVAIGDFNLDGNPDLAVTYFCNGSPCTNGAVAIFLGTGKGTFHDPVFYPYAEGGPFLAAVGDFNGDGNPDLAVGDISSGTIRVLSGNGDGTFQVGAPFAAPPAFSISFVVGDFNGDGKLDLAGANGNNSMALLLGNGDGTFQPAITTEVNSGFGNFGPPEFAAADFNGDGKLDLAVIGSSSITVLLGNGHGKFRAVRGSDGISAYAVAVGDFNNDGKPDLAVDDGSNVTVLLNVYRGFRH
jgi:hypothetical protein